MKKLFRTMLCAALLTAAVSIPAFAAEQEPPQKQGDFSVLVNGTYVTFSDAAPQIRNSRSCLPFVAVMEQLGFAQEDMTWDGNTSTVTAAKGDTTIALSIGKNQITLTKAGQATVIDTDVAPYVDSSTSRTYVPLGLVADALGYKVGWDAWQKTVIIDDVDAILAANSETYTLMDKYMAYNKSFYEKNQNITGKYAMDFSVDMEEGSLAFDMDGTYRMLTAGATAFQFETDMTMDMDMAAADPTDLADSSEALDIFPLDIDMDMRGDLSTGVFYLQSGAMADLMGQPDLANAWYKLDLASLFDQMESVTGMNYASLMQLSLSTMDMSFEESLDTMLRLMPLTSASLNTTDYLALLNSILADSAFQKSGSTYVSTLEQDGMVMTFTLYTNGSKVNGYAVTVGGSDPAFGGVEMTVSMKGSKMEMSMSMLIADDETGSVSLTMQMDGTYKTTTEQPAAQPPADAVVIDLTQMMGLSALSA